MDTLYIRSTYNEPTCEPASLNVKLIRVVHERRQKAGRLAYYSRRIIKNPRARRRFCLWSLVCLILGGIMFSLVITAIVVLYVMRGT